MFMEAEATARNPTLWPKELAPGVQRSPQALWTIACIRLVLKMVHGLTSIVILWFGGVVITSAAVEIFADPVISCSLRTDSQPVSAAGDLPFANTRQWSRAFCVAPISR